MKSTTLNLTVSDLPEPTAAGVEAKAGGMSKSFLHNLVGFLKSKV